MPTTSEPRPSTAHDAEPNRPPNDTEGNDGTVETGGTVGTDGEPRPSPWTAVGWLLAATALRALLVLFESAVPLVTLALLVGVEALVAGGPRVAVSTPGGELSLPLTEALVALALLELARRLYALNAP
ncbi:hypothetical protein ACFQPA_13665 [Halomarina halobia]|uniref:Uncharacterized protein n=1 Tax=Halomarina halobia TaxID=3033386 RepID=A0ABD6A951_9EURY|nr:hypothetical protein [Halomarina sp. PSR21]